MSLHMLMIPGLECTYPLTNLPPLSQPGKLLLLITHPSKPNSKCLLLQEVFMTSSTVMTTTQEPSSLRASY